MPQDATLGWRVARQQSRSASLSPLAPTPAPSNSGAAAGTASAIQKLTAGYSAAAGAADPTDPLADVLAAMLRTQAQDACTPSDTACLAKSPATGSQGNNLGAGRLRTAHRPPSPLLEGLVNASGSTITLATPASTAPASGGAPEIGGASPTATPTPAPSATPTPTPGASADPSASPGADQQAAPALLRHSDAVGYRRSTTDAQPDGTAAVSHTLSYTALVPPPPADHTDPWTAFTTIPPTAADQRICLGRLTLAYDRGADLDSITFTHAVEGPADGALSSIAAQTPVTSLITTTLNVTQLGSGDHDTAITWARTIALASGALTIPLTALAGPATQSGGFADLLDKKASSTLTILQGSAITDHGGVAALAKGWTASTLSADHGQLAQQAL